MHNVHPHNASLSNGHECLNDVEDHRSQVEE